LRSFSGLIVTCGLDHILFMHEDDRATILRPAQDRQAFAARPRRHDPARLTGYGERWDGDECTLWAEGIVQQSTVFGEDLHLIRRIEAKVGSNEIRCTTASSITASTRRRTCTATTSMSAAPVLAEGALCRADPRSGLGRACRRRLPQAGRRLSHPAGAADRISTSRSGSMRWPPTRMAGCRGAGQRPPRLRLRGRDPKDQFPCHVRVAEPAGRPVRDGHRAFDQPCAGQDLRARARRTDLARAWRRAPLRHDVPHPCRPGRDGRAGAASAALARRSSPTRRATIGPSPAVKPIRFVAPGLARGGWPSWTSHDHQAKRSSTPARRAGSACRRRCLSDAAGATVVAVDNDPAKVAKRSSRRGRGAAVRRLVVRGADLSDLAGFRADARSADRRGRRLRRGHQQCRDLSVETVRGLYDRGASGGPAGECRCRHRRGAGRPAGMRAEGLWPHHQHLQRHLLGRLGQPLALCRSRRAR
jgi:hypothetical protein